MYNFSLYELQRVDSELLSKRAHRAYSQLPQIEDSFLERAVAAVRNLLGQQTTSSESNKAERTGN